MSSRKVACRTRTIVKIASWSIGLTALLGLTGCEESVRDRLQGHWLGERAENFPAGQLAKVTGWARGASMTFERSQATISIPAESPRSGAYKVTELGENELRVRFVKGGGESDEARFRLVEENRLHWDLGNGREIVFVKEEAN